MPGAAQTKPRPTRRAASNTMTRHELSVALEKWEHAIVAGGYDMPTGPDRFIERANDLFGMVGK